MSELKALFVAGRTPAESKELPKKRPASKAEPPMEWEPGQEL